MYALIINGETVRTRMSEPTRCVMHDGTSYPPGCVNWQIRPDPIYPDPPDPIPYEETPAGIAYAATVAFANGLGIGANDKPEQSAAKRAALLHAPGSAGLKDYVRLMGYELEEVKIANGLTKEVKT